MKNGEERRMRLWASERFSRFELGMYSAKCLPPIGPSIGPWRFTITFKVY